MQWGIKPEHKLYARTVQTTIAQRSWIYEYARGEEGEWIYIIRTVDEYAISKLMSPFGSSHVTWQVINQNLAGVRPAGERTRFSRLNGQQKQPGINVKKKKN